MDSPSNLPGRMQPPQRRSYKRISPGEWERQRPRIQQLYVDECKEIRDVIRILKEQDDFDIGLTKELENLSERQLKRKLGQWKFSRYISSRDMRKMIRKRAARRTDRGRVTAFDLRQGANDFQKISQERLDRYERRFGPEATLSPLPCSSLPSHLVYYTPPRYDSPDRAGSTDLIAAEFNDSVEQIFGESSERGGQQLALGSSPLPSPRGAVLPREPSVTYYMSGRDLVFDGNYQRAHEMFNKSRLLCALVFGPDSHGTVMAEFNAAIVKAAEYPGCPQNLVARIAQELSVFLTRERQKYAGANRGERDLLELRKVLTALNLTSWFYSAVLPQQRALQIWEPVLGADHPKIKLIHDNIALWRLSEMVSLDKQPSLIQDLETLSTDVWDMDTRPGLAPIADMLHLGDGRPDELLAQFNALKVSDTVGLESRRRMRLLRLGRSRSLLGAYNSFLGRNEEADWAFQESNRYMEYEANIEIKLHRIIWYAEHRTRLREWTGVMQLLREAHGVYMSNQTPSEFVIMHFPGRFECLSKAISAQVAIDEVKGWDLGTENNTASVAGGDLPMLDRDRIGYSPAEIRPSDAEALFALTPGGCNFAIDVEKWSQFVAESPNGVSAGRILLSEDHD